jgi:hypothetical protein
MWIILLKIKVRETGEKEKRREEREQEGGRIEIN